MLETVRALDEPRPEDVEAVHQELAKKKLGTSRTVQAQIERFRSLAAREARVEPQEVEALLRLVARRADAGLVFTDAGRRAAREGINRIGKLTRVLQGLLPRASRNALGRVLARRVLERVFGIALFREGRRLVAEPAHSLSVEATPDGSACKFYGAAVGAILATFTEFDGALLHDSCVGRGDRACRWHTSGTLTGAVHGPA
ncbi:MAG: hypothetical protein ACE5PT_03265 [Gemmatimonadales bacterium]